ncbi:MAG: GyrI-like domain-containing protein [bacterium]|nr:GyrI-like domain-containing protein [bacterium]
MTKESFKVVGILITAKWSDLRLDMPIAWDDFKESFNKIKYRVNDVFMDIRLEKKQGVYKQLICAEVSDVLDVPEGMVFELIPAGHYIHWGHWGPVEKIAGTFGKMYDWANENTIETGDFKIDIGYTLEGNEQYHDLYIEIPG